MGGGRVPPLKAGGLLGRARDTSRPTGVQASRLTGVTGPSKPVSLGCGRLHSHGEERGWVGDGGTGGNPVGHWDLPPWHLPCQPLPLCPSSDTPSHTIPCRPTQSHPVPCRITPSKNSSLPVSPTGAHPSAAPRALGAQPGPDRCGNPQGLACTPAAQGPGNSCRRFLLRSRSWLRLSGGPGGWLCIWGGLSAAFEGVFAFGEDPGAGFAFG